MEKLLNAVMLGLPFFLWGSNMVVMEDLMPKTGTLFMAVTRLIPGGALILTFASLRGKKFPSGTQAWLSIAVFALINGTLFQSCLVEGLARITAGLGSVIIDSQPITVAILATIFYGEIVGSKSIIAMVFGILGLIIIEVPISELYPHKIAPPQNLTHVARIWDSGEWWMLLAAQTMAVGTVLMRWVSKFSDPLMVIGWHMVLGGIPILALSYWKQEPAVSGHLHDLSLADWASLAYTAVFGSAVATGLFFYNATRGSLTELSALTLLTPLFASFFGYLFRNETLTELQLVGSLITLVSICFIKVEKPKDTEAVDPLKEALYEAVPPDATV